MADMPPRSAVSVSAWKMEFSREPAQPCWHNSTSLATATCKATSLARLPQPPSCQKSLPAASSPTCQHQ